jgi:hypothetical protein
MFHTQNSSLQLTTKTVFTTSKMPQSDSPSYNHQLQQFASHLTAPISLSQGCHPQHHNAHCLDSLAQPPCHNLMSLQEVEQHGCDSSHTSQTNPPLPHNHPRQCNAQQYPNQLSAISESAFSTCSEISYPTTQTLKLAGLLIVLKLMSGTANMATTHMPHRMSSNHTHSHQELN